MIASLNKLSRGLTYMKHKQASLYYLQYLWDCKKRSFDDLSDDQCAKLSGLMLFELSKQDRFEMLVESNSFYQVIDDLINYLISFDSTPSSLTWLEHHKNCENQLLQSFTKCSINAFKKSINNCFDFLSDKKFQEECDFYNDDRFHSERVNGLDWRR